MKDNEAKKQRRRRFGIVDVLLVLLVIAGVGIALYPLISQYYYRYKTAGEIKVFKAEARHVADEDVEKRVLLAQAYNDLLLNGIKSETNDPFASKDKESGAREYARMLELNEKIGVIKIPRIAQELPIYAGTSEDVLQKGVGHMPGTSLPIGGPGTHCVLTAHSGLPNARLFTDLDQLQVGDRVYIENMKETIAYQVTMKEVVEPTDFQSLTIVPGKDQVTLLTCTPYMINSHRLLVHAERVDYVSEVERRDMEVGGIDRRYRRMFYAVSALALILLVSRIRSGVKNKRLKNELEEYRNKFGQH